MHRYLYSIMRSLKSHFNAHCTNNRDSLWNTSSIGHHLFHYYLMGVLLNLNKDVPSGSTGSSYCRRFPYKYFFSIKTSWAQFADSDFLQMRICKICRDYCLFEASRWIILMSWIQQIRARFCLILLAYINMTFWNSAWYSKMISQQESRMAPSTRDENKTIVNNWKGLTFCLVLTIDLSCSEKKNSRISLVIKHADSYYLWATKSRNRKLQYAPENNIYLQSLQ